MAKKKRQATVRNSSPTKAEPQHPVLAEDHDLLARDPAKARGSLDVDESRNEPRGPKNEARASSSAAPEGSALTSRQDFGEQSLAAAFDAATPQLPSIRHKRLSMVQKILVSCIVLIVAILLYVLGSRQAGSLLVVPATRPPQVDESLSKSTSTIPDLIADKSRGTRDEGRAVATGPSTAGLPRRVAGTAGSRPIEGLSLRIAETFYLQKDFNKAYAAYDQLRSTCDQEDPLKDFLALKMAFCMKNVGDSDQAAQIFRMVSQSHYPVVRTVANYHLSLLEMQKEQYLNARRRAYQTMALISALTFDWQWTLQLARNCQFLIAESVTRHVLSLCDADKDCPAQLWPTPSEVDPFINLSESELRCLLNCGSEQLRGAQLSPQIQQLPPKTKLEPRFSGLEARYETRQRPTSLERWEVCCNGATIEELLARFAAHAGLDIHWACDPTEDGLQAEKDTLGTPAQSWEGNPRKKPVSLYMSAATTQQFVTAAAGCVGLLAQLDDKGTVKILNPSDYASLSEHLALLAQEAVSLWQRFLLTFGDDESAEDFANAHFALGLLQAQRGYLSDAIAQYKLVANRYTRTPLAPYALLASSKLKVNLRDYLGAREDLKLLTEQYPDTEFSDQALLHLADATMKAGLLQEAARLYCKVYNLGFSLQSQKVSALSAGRCFYQVQDYENTAKWLTRYINLDKNRTGRDFSLACLLLGKTYLAQDLHQQACNAFELALSGNLPVQEYVETVSALVKAHLKLGHFVEALKLLENTNSWQLSQKESIEMILLEASVLRSMGLADEAIAVLGDKAEYVLDPQLKAKISFEQAKCSIAKGDLSLARKNLSEILVLIEPSATDGLAQDVRCELADVCARLGADSQAIWICLQLLDSQPDAAIKQRALDLLATAYRRQKNYDQAALALLGQWPGRSGE